jgi:hypothetical protein
VRRETPGLIRSKQDMHRSWCVHVSNTRTPIIFSS